MGIESNYTYGDTYTRDGQSYKVLSNPLDSGYITVKDDEGNVIRMKKDAALLHFAEEARAERKETIEKYQSMGDDYTAERADWRQKAKDFLAQMGLFNQSDDEYAELKDQYWDARMSATAASNRAYSSYQSAFIAATDTTWA